MKTSGFCLPSNRAIQKNFPNPTQFKNSNGYSYGKENFTLHEEKEGYCYEKKNVDRRARMPDARLVDGLRKRRTEK